MVTVRCLLNIVVLMSWSVFQLDVNNAFLYGDLEETIYMKPPEGYFPSGNKVCRLKKSLYGLKQAPRQWNAKLISTLIENGFSQSKSDYSLYTKSDKGVFLALLVYMDDIIIAGNSVSEIEKFKVFLKKYVLDLLSLYGMLACKPVSTPLLSKLVISNEATEKDHVLENITNYQKLMGLGIHIVRTSGMFLNGFFDADWAKCVITRKSVTANPVFHERTKHLEIDLHFVREIFLKGVVKTVKVESENQITDILTKGLDTIQHKGFVEKLGLFDIYQVTIKGDVKM
ncbi:ribonuclease H-like domain-containing protein [Tanacetum coccineum]